VDSERRCGFGYTIGDGWKLIYYPEHFPDWSYAMLNMLWVAGWTVGMGWWTARAWRTPIAYAAIALVAGLVAVPLVTGLNATPIIEWIGASIGLSWPIVTRTVA